MLLKIVLKIVIWEFTNDYIMSKFVTIFKSDTRLQDVIGTDTFSIVVFCKFDCFVIQ